VILNQSKLVIFKKKKKGGGVYIKKITGRQDLYSKGKDIPLAIVNKKKSITIRSDSFNTAPALYFRKVTPENIEGWLIMSQRSMTQLFKSTSTKA
jgi:hypothetical protein